MPLVRCLDCPRWWSLDRRTVSVSVLSVSASCGQRFSKNLQIAERQSNLMCVFVPCPLPKTEMAASIETRTFLSVHRLSISNA